MIWLVLWLVLSSLIGATAALAEATPSAQLFDSAEWEVQRSVPANFGNGQDEAVVTLLRSIRPTGISGVGGPLYAVNLIISAGQRILYEFTSQPKWPCTVQGDVFFMDAEVTIRDVTGDGLKEVLFHSGTVAADGYSKRENVIHRVGEEWWNIAPPQFVASSQQRLRWIDRPRVPVVVIAEPIYPADPDDPHSCRQCPHFFQYSVFQWAAQPKAFINVRSVLSSRDFADGVDPLEHDLGLALKGLEAVE